MHRRHLLAMGASLPLSWAVSPAQAAPEAQLWDRWLVRNNQSRTSVDHSMFGQFLAAYVQPETDGVNRVTYGRVTDKDRAVLERYIKDLGATRVETLNYPEQLAFWINLYNALTISTVLAHYPVKSIRDIDISPGLFSKGPWGAKLTTVSGVEVSLDDIEHRIIRPIFNDARIHYAVNCASVGCPNLAKKPYTGSGIWIELDLAARSFVNHPRGVTISDGRVIASKIYDWYEADFGSNDQEVIRHMMSYAGMRLAKELQESDHEIDKYVYDWQLNDAT